MTFTRAHALLPAALLPAGAALPAPARAQNLLQNSSFEQGTFTGGGTVTNAEIALLANGTYNLATPYGNYFLDLTGYHDTSPYGGVT